MPQDMEGELRAFAWSQLGPVVDTLEIPLNSPEWLGIVRPPFYSNRHALFHGESQE